MTSFNSRLRFVSLTLVLSFGAQQLAWAAPEMRPVRQDVFQKPEVRLNVPESVATVEDAYAAPGAAKMIYLIQDAHTNESGQLNLSKTLDSILNQEKDLRYVFSEAAVGDNSLSFLRQFRTADEREKIAMSYIRKGLLHGTEYLDLTSEHAFVLWGVESPELYVKSLEDYRAVAADRERFQNYLSRIAVTVDALKSRIFNPSLSVFENQYEKYHKDNIALTEYFEALLQEARKHDVALDAYPHLASLKELKQKESAIDFQKANEEQLRAVQGMSAEDQKALVDASDDKSPFRLSNRDEKEGKAFYALLEEKLAGRVTEFPELAKYFEYLKLAKSMEAKKILDEVKALENALFEKLAASDDEKNLVRCVKQLSLLNKLFMLTLTPEEFRDYKELSSGFGITELTGFLNKKIMDFGQYYERTLFLESGYDDMVKRSEDFYSLTQLRDIHFIDRSIEKMDAEKQSRAVLVTGGFHTPNLKSLLKEKGISFVSITPQVLKETNIKRYESILLSQEIKSTTPSVNVNAAKNMMIGYAANQVPLLPSPIGVSALFEDFAKNPSDVSLVIGGLSNLAQSQIAAARLAKTDEDRRIEKRIDEIKKWWASPRFAGVKRLHSAEQVASLQIATRPDYTVQNAVARKFYDTLRRHQAAGTAVNTFGPFSEVAAEAMVRSGIEGIYFGGWAEAMRSGTSDQARYPYTWVAEFTSRVSRFLQQKARQQAEARSRMTPEQRAATPEIDYLVPFFVDADTGHLAPKELVSTMMTYGSDSQLIGALHFEDQAHGCKKCGHMAGKVLVSTDEHIKRLNEARLQLDLMGLETLIVARTDAEAAEFITSNLDRRDHPFILGATNPEIGPYHALIQEARSKGLSEADVEKIHNQWRQNAGLVTLGEAVAKTMEEHAGQFFNTYTPDEIREFAKSHSIEEVQAKAKEIGVNVYLSKEAFKVADRRSGIHILWDWDLPKTEELGYALWMIQSGTEMAIARSKAFLPYADIQWMEQHHPSVEQTKEWASALIEEANLLGMPQPILANNTSPSFYWRAEHEGHKLSDEQLSSFLDEQAKAGVQFQFITYGGSELDNYGIQKFVKAFKENGMLAWADFQDEAIPAGNPFVKGSQSYAGVNYQAALDATGRGASVVSPTGAKDTMAQFGQALKAEEPKGARLAAPPAAETVTLKVGESHKILGGGLTFTVSEIKAGKVDIHVDWQPNPFSSHANNVEANTAEGKAESHDTTATAGQTLEMPFENGSSIPFGKVIKVEDGEVQIEISSGARLALVASSIDDLVTKVTPEIDHHIYALNNKDASDLDSTLHGSDLTIEINKPNGQKVEWNAQVGLQRLAGDKSALLKDAIAFIRRETDGIPVFSAEIRFNGDTDLLQIAAVSSAGWSSAKEAAEAIRPKSESGARLALKTASTAELVQKIGPALGYELYAFQNSDAYALNAPNFNADFVIEIQKQDRSSVSWLASEALRRLGNKEILLQDAIDFIQRETTSSAGFSARIAFRGEINGLEITETESSTGARLAEKRLTKENFGTAFEALVKNATANPSELSVHFLKDATTKQNTIVISYNPAGAYADSVRDLEKQAELLGVPFSNLEFPYIYDANIPGYRALPQGRRQIALQPNAGNYKFLAGARLADEAAVVTLKNGAVVPVGVVVATKQALDDLAGENLILLYALVEKARNHEKDLGIGFTNELKKVGLLQPDGSIHQAVRDIILSSVRGEGLETTEYTGDPVQRGARLADAEALRQEFKKDALYQSFYDHEMGQINWRAVAGQSARSEDDTAKRIAYAEMVALNSVNNQRQLKGWAYLDKGWEAVADEVRAVTGNVIQPPAQVNSSLEERYARLFEEKDINGRKLKPAQVIADLAGLVSADIPKVLTARRKLLESEAPTREKYAFPDWNQTFEDADGNVRTFREIVQGMIDNFFGVKSDVSWRLNDAVPVSQDIFPLSDARLQVTGPSDPAKMIYNQMNADLAVRMPDSEDASAAWEGNPSVQPIGVFQGLLNELAVLSGEWDGVSANIGGKDYSLTKERQDRPTTIQRVPGMHLQYPYITVNGKPTPAIAIIYALHALNTYGTLQQHGSGNYYYQPKMQTPAEALIVAKLLNRLEDLMGLKRGTIKIEMLYEEGNAGRFMPAIMWVLRDRLIGSNVGRWDYIGSLMEMWKNDAVWPDPQGITMASPNLVVYQRLNALLNVMAGVNENLEETNGAPIGGMAAVMLYPNTDLYGRYRNNPKALRSMKLDKLRERLIGLIFVPEDASVKSVSLEDALSGKVAGRLYDSYRQSWVATTDKDYVAAGNGPLATSIAELQALIDAPEEWTDVDGKPVPTVASGLIAAEKDLLKTLKLLNQEGKIEPWVVTKNTLSSPESFFNDALWEGLYGVPTGELTAENLQLGFFMQAQYGFQILNGNYAAAIDDYALGLRFMNDLATYRIFNGHLWTVVRHGGKITKDGWLKGPVLDPKLGVIPGENKVFVKAGTVFDAELFQKMWDLHNEWTKAFFAEQDKLGAESRFDRSQADVIMDVLHRQMSSDRYLQHSPRILFAIAGLDANRRKDTLDAIFSDSREEVVAKVNAGAWDKSVLAAHDYVYDYFPQVEEDTTVGARLADRPNFAPEVRARLVQLAEITDSEKIVRTYANYHVSALNELTGIAAFSGFEPKDQLALLSVFEEHFAQMAAKYPVRKQFKEHEAKWIAYLALLRSQRFVALDVEDVATIINTDIGYPTPFGARLAETAESKIVSDIITVLGRGPLAEQAEAEIMKAIEANPLLLLNLSKRLKAERLAGPREERELPGAVSHDDVIAAVDRLLKNEPIIAIGARLSTSVDSQLRAFTAQIYTLFPREVQEGRQLALADAKSATPLVLRTKIETVRGVETLILEKISDNGAAEVFFSLENPRQAAQALKDNKALAKENPAASVLLQKALLEKNVQVALEGSPSVIDGTPRLVFSLGVYADIEHDSIFELALKQQAMALSKARQKYPQATFHILGKVSDSRQAIVQSVFSQLQGVSYEAPEDGVIISFDTPQSPAFKTDLDHVRLPVAQVKDNEVISWTSLLGLGLASAAVFSKDGKVDFKSTQATDSNLDRLVSAYRLESGTQIDSLTFVQIVSNKASLTTVLKYLLRPILPILDQALSVHQLITKVVGQAA